MKKPPRLRINEVFHSVQGEGTRTGVRCVFVRLTGCHLRCTYCDTEYAFYNGDWMTLDTVLDCVRQYDCPVVEVTGGEPLLQPAVFPLMKRLADECETVLLETSGALSIADVDPRVVRIVDIKCPASGEAQSNHWANIGLLTPRDEVKFVLANRGDYEWARDALERYDLPTRCPVILAPAHGTLEPLDLTEWILKDRLNVRVGVHLHKLIWSPEMRGV